MKLKHLPALRRHLGTRWFAKRALYAVRLRTGALRWRLPVANWSEDPLADVLTDSSLAEPERYLQHRRRAAPRFFFAPSDRAEYAPLLKQWDKASAENPIAAADAIGRGLLRYFEHREGAAGCPPDWHSNPFTGERAPVLEHWSTIGDFENGDIKVIWEPSRFAFVYTLVRAYWRTGDERFAQLFWQFVESWQAQNEPQQGPNWKCGQEASFRTMAWCFGLYGFLGAQSTTAPRVARLAEMLAVTGRRIEANISYALNQANNHGISEGMGLWTIGCLFPELRGASKWRSLGRKVLEKEGRKLIYEDGSFSQHSVNYHRLMLHDYVWSVRLGQLHGEPFSDELVQRVERAGAFLFQIQDEETGAVPLYGQNDGALVLPLSNCGYHDYRPVVAATQYVTTKTRTYEVGLWDEDLLWLCGPDSLRGSVAARSREDFRADAGGYYSLRGQNSFVFTRCATLRHRPAQADMLHVDLWWRGQNIAVDAGTFSYNATGIWDNAFSRTAPHNTVTVDEEDQMERVSKFLWLPWARGTVRSFQRSARRQLAYFEGEHDGYERLTGPVLHRRGIAQIAEDSWLVIDDLRSEKEHDYRLHWLLADLPHDWEREMASVTLRTPRGHYFVQGGARSSLAELTLTRSDPESTRGWRSRFYGDREPTLSLAVKKRAKSAFFWTVFSPERCQVDAAAEKIITIAKGASAIRLELNTASGDPLVSLISTGSDELEVVPR